MRSIQTMSDQFTKDRSDLGGDYFSDIVSLCSYGLFFFPQSYMRISILLEEIRSRGWAPADSLSILDLGAGSGSASLSASSFFSDVPSAITAIDHSHNALSHFQRIASDCISEWPLLRSMDFSAANIWDWVRAQNKKWDLVIASFSLNESRFTYEEWSSALLNLLGDQGILIVVEPATKTASELLESWRDHIRQTPDIHIWAPCLHNELCPLFQEGKFWCHEVRSWQPPATVRFLNRRLYRQSHVLKYSFLVLGRSQPDKISDSFRLISPVSRDKKSIVFSGCTTEGEKKDFRISGALKGKIGREFKSLERGDVVSSFLLNRERFS